MRLLYGFLSFLISLYVPCNIVPERLWMISKAGISAPDFYTNRCTQRWMGYFHQELVEVHQVQCAGLVMPLSSTYPLFPSHSTQFPGHSRFLLSRSSNKPPNPSSFRSLIAFNFIISSPTVLSSWSTQVFLPQLLWKADVSYIFWNPPFQVHPGRYLSNWHLWPYISFSTLTFL